MDILDLRLYELNRGIENYRDWTTSYWPPVGIKIQFSLKGDNSLHIGYTGMYDSGGRTPGAGTLVFCRETNQVHMAHEISGWRGLPFEESDL